MIKDGMTDLETLGTVPGCAILSIGAVRFDYKTGKLGDEFYIVVDRQSCADAGLHEDPGTLAWWAKQSEAARRVLRYASDEEEGATPLADALEQFNAWIKKVPGTRIWGNGADFDNPILACAYKAVGMKQGWAPFNGRCYRTVKNMYPQTAMGKRIGTYHNALDDAKNQALHLMEIVENHSLVLG